jgi:methionyl-tRNA formyltransferase
MKIIFAGTACFAVPFLDALMHSQRHQVIAVYTQPDRPAGRGLKLTASPVKVKALCYNLPLYQPATFRASTNTADDSNGIKHPAQPTQLQQLHADVMVTVAYGILLPPEILNIPRYGCINVHPSLLPRWRGAAPIQRALLAGDRTTGVTIMQTDAGLDTGDILQQVTLPIGEQDTTTILEQKLIAAGTTILAQTLDKIEQNTIIRTKQDHAHHTIAAKLKKEEGKIDWHNDNATTIARMVRAFNPRPIAWSFIEQDGIMVPLKIWEADAVSIADGGTFNTTTTAGTNTRMKEIKAHAAGTIINASKNGIDVAAGKNSVLRIHQIQLPGKKVLAVRDLLNAHAEWFKPGKCFK